MDNQIQTKEGSREVISLMENENESSMAGCTANVCLIAKKVLYCANSGDSRSVIRKNTVKYYLLKESIALSVDHKPELPEENKRVISAGGYGIY